MNQYDVARHDAGIIDGPKRGTIVVSGADRASWLQGLLTNDINALLAGRGCYSAWLTPQGRMITDMNVIEIGDRILLDVPGYLTGGVAARLEQLIFAEDVKLENESESFQRFRVVGPRAAAIVAAAVRVVTQRPQPPGEQIANWVEYQNAVFPEAESQLIVVRNNELGVAGYDICETRTELRRTLESGGSISLDESVGETLRIEAGRPLFGVDMDTDTIPLEAGIEDRAISFSKGCYVGQEVIVRVMSRGHGRVVRKLVGLTLDGARIPNAGERLFSESREIGRITSATRSPALDRPVALGYVHRDFVEAGTSVTVGSGSGDRALVTQLPFVSLSAQSTAG